MILTDSVFSWKIALKNYARVYELSTWLMHYKHIHFCPFSLKYTNNLIIIVSHRIVDFDLYLRFHLQFECQSSVSDPSHRIRFVFYRRSWILMTRPAGNLSSRITGLI